MVVPLQEPGKPAGVVSGTGVLGELSKLHVRTYLCTHTNAQ